MSGRTVAIIPARGGSKGIPRKNLMPFCGKPLLVWSIEDALESRSVESCWVSSDSDEILEVAERHGAKPIRRPADISGDTASSESAWLHALDEVERRSGSVDVLVALQATSPLRDGADIDGAVAYYHAGGFDSVLSGDRADDFLVWRAVGETMDSVNYDYRKRGRRQDRPPQYHENGSIYVVSPAFMREHNNRLGGRIGVYEMPAWKGLQIDSQEEAELCELTLRAYAPATLERK